MTIKVLPLGCAKRRDSCQVEGSSVRAGKYLNAQGREVTDPLATYRHTRIAK